MDFTFTGYRRRDWCIALVLALFLLFIAGIQLTSGMPSWGDDFSAYIAEGIAISKGTFREQTVLNYGLHPSAFSAEANEAGLVYVWGFPMLLSLVHRVVGFDTVNYSSIFFYKLPSLMAFALMAGVLYLFYRRFFQEKLAAFLTLVFCVSGNMIEAIDILNVDIVFLSASMLSLWLAECFFFAAEQPGFRGKFFCLSAALGVSLWFTYETRLNGNTVVLIIAIAHLVRLLRANPRYSFRQILRQIYPYAIFLVLKYLSEQILLPATPNVSDIGKVSIQQLLSNLRYYWDLTRDYFTGLAGNLPLWPILFVFLVIGLVREGLRWKNLPYTALLVGTYVVLILLPYTQGLRYLFNILPILLLFIAYGGQAAVLWLCSKKPAAMGAVRRILAVAAVLLLLVVYVPEGLHGMFNLRSRGYRAETDVYHPASVEMFHYIRDNVGSDEIVAFVKPRALYLHTGKLSFCPNVNGHKLEDADYYLVASVLYIDEDLTKQEGQTLTFDPVYENSLFSLYKIQKEK